MKSLIASIAIVGLLGMAVGVAVKAQVWDQPQGKQAFGHTHEWPTLLSFPADCSAGQFVSGVGATLTCATPTAGTDNDWSGAGTGQMYATFPSDNVGIGTTTPLSRLHIDESLSTTFDAVKVTFDNNPGFQTAGTGIKIDGAPLTVKGTSRGVWADTSKTAGPDPQRGSARGLLATSSGFFLSGNFQGAQGLSVPEALSNFDNTITSTGLGGFFRAQPDGTLSLNNTGTYWVGGAYGEVAGTINHTPASGAVAGIIGIDNADGTAKSYAGYFKGDVRATEYVQVGLSSGTPPAADCNEASEMGRMKVDDSGGGFLYVCTPTTAGIGWVAK